MTDTIKQKLCKVLELCVEVTELGCDCYMAYEGHVNYYSASHSDGKWRGNDMIFFNIASEANEINLDSTIQKLEALKAEWSNKK